MPNDPPPADAGTRQRRPWWWRLLRTVAIGYVLLCLVMFCLETWLVYPGITRPPGPTARSLGDNSIDDVYFSSADGTRIHAWFYPAEGTTNALLYCHGNGELVQNSQPLVEHLRTAWPANVLVFNYRGYGHSEGRPNEAGVLADGVAAQQWLADRVGIEPGEVVLLGRSLGTGVAVALAAEQGARGLILHSGYADLPQIGAARYPLLPVRLMMRNRYPSAQRIENYRGPLLQLHGTNDQLIPIEMGRELFAAAPSPQKQFLEIDGAGHNRRVPADALQALVAFLQSLDASAVSDQRE